MRGENRRKKRKEKKRKVTVGRIIPRSVLEEKLHIGKLVFGSAFLIKKII